MRQLRSGIPLPTTTERDSLQILHEIWNGPDNLELHKKAARGFKEAGLSVDLDGKEDDEITKEAAEFWKAPVPRVRETTPTCGRSSTMSLD